MRRAIRISLAVSLALVLSAVVSCADDGRSDARSIATQHQAAARSGPWDIPDDVRRAGEEQYVAYDGAPAWEGGRNCGGTFHPGTRELAEYLVDTYDGISHYGGYHCRPNSASPSRTSVHGTGRAIDLTIPTDGGSADNDLGDPIANWLILNAELIGVQYLIWDRWQWTAARSGRKDRAYTGPHPHHDHIHIELTHEAAARGTPWFEERCAVIDCEDVEEDGGDDICTSGPVDGAEDEVFADVPESQLGHPSIEAIWRAGITNGCSDEPRLYCPNCPVTRYQFVTFLLRADGIEPGPVEEPPRFTDVPDDVWWRRWVEEAARRRITLGCNPPDNTRFCPHDVVTRETAAAFIARARGWSPIRAETPRFEDVPESNIFRGAIEAIADRCVTRGCNPPDNTRYCPDGDLLRSHAAIFITRAWDIEGMNSCIEECDPDACEESSFCEEWGDCRGFGGACGEEGERSRRCHDFACEASGYLETCGVRSRTETGDCARDTDGDVVEPWSAWSACDEGSQRRERVVCESGRSVTRSDLRSCGDVSPVDAGPDDSGEGADTVDLDPDVGSGDAEADHDGASEDSDVGPGDVGDGEDTGDHEDAAEGGTDDAERVEDTRPNDDIGSGEDTGSGDGASSGEDTGGGLVQDAVPGVVEDAGEGEEDDRQRPARLKGSGCAVAAAGSPGARGALVAALVVLVGVRRRLAGRG